MNVLLILAFLFFVGSTVGWGMELVFRKYFSDANPEHKWINPGFCTGPYLPIYGFGLCALYLLASMEQRFGLSKAVLFILMAVSMTAIEYIAGILCLKCSKLRLWDYSNEWGNVQGIICPKFSLFWAILGALYYFLIHPFILDALNWLSRNLAFSFFIGMFFGVFLVDYVHSAQLVNKIKAYAEDNHVVIRYEALKVQIRRTHELNRQKYHFFRPLHSEIPLREHLKELMNQRKSNH